MPKPTREHEQLLKTAIDRFKVAAEAEKDQRQRELDDLKFDSGQQWPDEVKAQRAGTTGPGHPAPARPCLTINKLEAPVLQVLNQQRNARLAIQIKPKGDGASQDDAEVRQGLIRHIEVESRAQIARSWAFERAVKCGRGFYRILKRYSNDGDYDQDLVIVRILNQHAVYCDPFAIEPDWSDGEWCFIVEDVPEKRYKREYPKSKLARVEDTEFVSVGDHAPGWMRGEKESRTYRVAEYFYVETEKREKVVILPTPEDPEGYDGWEDELPEDHGREVAQRRTLETRTVKWCKLNAIEILEEAIWDGRYIPVVPVIGREYNVDGVRTFKGIISNAKDAQRSYNYMRSAQVEAIGLAPRAPFIMAEGQDEGYEEMWANANTINYPSLKYRPVSLMGQPVPPPQRNVTEPAIQAITLATAAADNDIKATTGVGDPSLGLMTPSDRSGKAIQALQQQSEAGNSNYLENLAAVSMTYEGKVLLDLLPHIYDRPGRIARILGEDDTDRLVMLNQPFQSVGGQPQPVNGAGPMPGVPVESYDLSKGQFGVVVTVGKAYKTQREEGVALIGELITAAPQMAPVISDLWVGDMDFPAARKISDRLKKMLPPQLQDEGQDQAMSPAAQQQIAQAQSQLQEMQGQMQQMQQVIETKQQELEAKAQIEEQKIAAKAETDRLKIESDERIAQIKAEIQIGATNAKIAADQHKAEMQALVQQFQATQSMRHESMMTGQKLASQERLQARSESAASAEAMRGRAHEQIEGERARTHEQIEGVEARAHEATEGLKARAHERASTAVNLQHESREANTQRRQERTLAKQQAAQKKKNPRP